jgi:Na+-transporting NADH:ubiquinone oxidoreductase subunit A
MTGPAPRKVSRVGIRGSEYPGVRFSLCVGEGDTVVAGEPILRDRRHPEIVFTANMGGAVGRIRRGARRALEWVEILADGGVLEEERRIPADPGAEELRHLMLESGLWTAFRSRPFGRLPSPESRPDAVFVTAIDTRPLAPDPAMVIGLHPDWFNAGLDALWQMAQRPVYCCVAPGTPPPAVKSREIRVVAFSGPHPAGLPGIHIHHLCPVGAGGRQVWQINYPDVMSLGRLLLEGRPWRERVVSVAGPGCGTPGLFEVAAGASVPDLVRDLKVDPGATLVAGAPTHGRVLRGADAWLGHRQYQVSILPDRGRASIREIHPMIPTTDLDRLAPPGILAAPLMRALLVGDSERARALGALELDEEDLGALSAACTSGADYGTLLRDTLDRIAREAG